MQRQPAAAQRLHASSRRRAAQRWAEQRRRRRWASCHAARRRSSSSACRACCGRRARRQQQQVACGLASRAASASTAARAAPLAAALAAHLPCALRAARRRCQRAACPASTVARLAAGPAVCRSRQLCEQPFRAATGHSRRTKASHADHGSGAEHRGVAASQADDRVAAAAAACGAPGHAQAGAGRRQLPRQDVLHFSALQVRQVQAAGRRVVWMNRGGATGSGER